MLTNLAPAGGRKELSYGNGTLQMFFYSIFAYPFINILPPVLGLKSFEVNIILSAIAKSVGICLGITLIFTIIAISLVIYIPILFAPLPGVLALIALINLWSIKKYFKPSLINL